ncbi:MAG: hypothetical protein IPL33_06755 [Sphingobacteriales bacterium]|nr:hypothetical protein [Sphingobacteriales bacterium]
MLIAVGIYRKQSICPSANDKYTAQKRKNPETASPMQLPIAPKNGRQYACAGAMFLSNTSTIAHTKEVANPYSRLQTATLTVR